MESNSDLDINSLLQDETFILWVKYGDSNELLDKKWNDWMTQNPNKEEAVQEARKIILSITGQHPFNLSETKQKEMWKAIDESTQESTPQKKISRILLSTQYRMAAALAVLLFAGWYALNKTSFIKTEKDETISRIFTAETDLVQFKNDGSKPYPIVLQDGSKVMLQPNSTIQYPQTFTEKSREVYLNGGAFFEVTKDPARLFIVYANKLVTQVLGTSFTGRAYDNEKNISVVVKTGKVSVSKY
ncbi:MAG: FecR family protein, partial [Cyclobacteriaceae bacterium]|nr:FecR family protein [Cyclobacteriaceae bacterium]